MNNKEIKFDILENADLEKIEQIGPDKNMIDDDAKNRMFAYAQKQYSKMSGKDIPENKTNSKEYICGVENMDKRKKSRIIMTVCSVAASFALIVGIAALLKGNLSKPPVKPGQLKNYDTHIIQEETEKVLKEFTASDDEVFSSIEYAQADLNNDEVPELVITCYPLAGDHRSFLYFFNGSEYVKSDEYLNNVMYNADSKLLITYGKNQRYALFEVSADNQLVVIDEVASQTDNYNDDVNNFCIKYELGSPEYTDYNWQDFDYTFYAEHNAANVE